MRIVDAGYQIIDEPSITKKIERIARVCYKSEECIGEDTDIKMINRLIERQHTAMLEHGDFAIIVDEDTYETLQILSKNIESLILEDFDSSNRKCYLRFSSYQQDTTTPARLIVSGNVRAWLDVMDIVCTYCGWIIPTALYNALVEGFPLFQNRYRHDAEGSNALCSCKLVTDYTELSNKERMIHETFTVLFVSDLLVQRELVRHREASFAGESTRYCNYSSDKFGNEITVIKPCFLKEGTEVYNEWKMSCEEAEKSYMILLNEGCTPQEARDVLPVATKCDTVITANLTEWRHIFNLRACDSTGPAHPKMKEIMIPCLKEYRNIYPFAFGDLIAADEVTK